MRGRATALLTGLSLVGAVLLGVGLPAVARATPAIQSAPRIPATLHTPGAQRWVSRYNGPGNDSDEARALGVSPDGSTVFVTGVSSGSTSSLDYATVAYDASTGSKLWVSRYNGPANSTDNAYALGVSPDGSTVFVTGASEGSFSADFATVAYDAATGAKLWLSRYNGPGNSGDYAYALGVSPSGSAVFVTGESAGSTTGFDYTTVAYDASTGTKLRVSRYNGPGNGDDTTQALGVSPDGSTVFVTGQSPGSTSYYDYATVAYDATTGAKRWVSRYNGPANGYDYAFALGVSPDGSTLFVTGESQASNNYYDYATVAYDASTGAQGWVNRYNGPGHRDDVATAVRVSPDGSTLFVTGYSWSSTSFNDYATVAYNATAGAQLWISRYNGPGNSYDNAFALGVSPDGSTLFVTGSSDSSSSADYATVAHDALTGARLWVSRYNGPGNDSDVARALGVSADGATVFVTGYSDALSIVPDYATVAYSTA